MTLCVVLTFGWMAVLSYKCGWWGISFHTLTLDSLEGYLATVLTSVSYMVLSWSCPSLLPLQWMPFLRQMCVLFPLILWLLFLFAAFAVTANGQVECSKGFKRMNLTHCQGKLYVHECAWRSYSSVCCYYYTTHWIFIRSSITRYLLLSLCFTSGPYWNQVKTIISFSPGSEFSSQSAAAVLIGLLCPEITVNFSLVVDL